MCLPVSGDCCDTTTFCFRRHAAYLKRHTGALLDRRVADELQHACCAIRLRSQTQAIYFIY
jgi:hypothetical protein